MYLRRNRRKLRPLFNAYAGEQARELVGDALERLRKPLPKIAALLAPQPRRTWSPSNTFPPTTGRSCARPTRSR
jgi:hypothetical protein